ncbi:UPF0203-domain-containing protein [Neurospora crassa]|nr:UPF0203-domain-containing protein [Neurospora crassa]CAF05893.1 conserved hypothetical protein [Neurospora crassa]
MSQSLAKECNEAKERYDTCFLKWYSEKYLRGNGTEQNNECSILFKEYSSCLQVALKERGIDKLLEEAREELKDSDSTYMGKKKFERMTDLLRIPELDDV